MTKYSGEDVTPHLLPETFWLVQHKQKTHQDLCRGKDYDVPTGTATVFCVPHQIEDSLRVITFPETVWISITKEKYNCLRNLL